MRSLLVLCILARAEVDDEDLGASGSGSGDDLFNLNAIDIDVKTWNEVEALDELPGSKSATRSKSIAGTNFYNTYFKSEYKERYDVATLEDMGEVPCGTSSVSTIKITNGEI